jgi:hypothetical protein
MGVNTRMIPVGATGGTITGWAGANDSTAGRRYYSCAVGSTIDVPGDPSTDANTLSSQGFVVVAMSGPTSSRPTTTGLIKPGALYIDTSLNVVLCWDGLVWRNVLTGATA